MLIYKYFDTTVIFCWSAFVLVFRDLVIQCSIIPQTYQLIILRKKQTNSTYSMVRQIWSYNPITAMEFSAMFTQSQSCPNPIFCCKPSKAGSQLVSDGRFLVDDFV